MFLIENDRQIGETRKRDRERDRERERRGVGWKYFFDFIDLYAI
jgi:hypothetical protein